MVFTPRGALKISSKIKEKYYLTRKSQIKKLKNRRNKTLKRLRKSCDQKWVFGAD